MVETVFSQLQNNFSYPVLTFRQQTFLISDCKSRESSMTRGNQRDMAREKAAKKDKGKQKASNEQEANKGMTKEQRMARYV